MWVSTCLISWVPEQVECGPDSVLSKHWMTLNCPCNAFQFSFLFANLKIKNWKIKFSFLTFYFSSIYIVFIYFIVKNTLTRLTQNKLKGECL